MTPKNSEVDRRLEIPGGCPDRLDEAREVRNRVRNPADLKPESNKCTPRAKRTR